jgi:hypothetical protein
MRRNPLSRRRAEAGSAYIAALLVLVLLTIFGMSLVLITSTERQIGSNQRTVSRIFYNADSGTAVAIASLLVNNDPNPKMLEISRANVLGGQVREEVETSRVSVVSTDHLNLTEINDSGKFKRVNHFFTTTSRRLLGAPTKFDTETGRTELRVVAQKQLSMMVEVQPMSVEAGTLYDEESGVTYASPASPPPP